MSNKLVNIVGLVTLFASVAYLIKKINKETETKLISDEAFDALQNKDNIDKLDNVLSNYRETGEWDRSELKNIN
ncbi:hypothetical protein [Tenacibaculum maritimum]|uniref:hypothetical protein n=1 Tax=Tenacibaculum maritimum TaxID=107401 RepID=UPI0012E693F9|nr:hypothetical protein [Tenacibaculum maritimum]CAA0236519.1 conserved hypothetical protein [Tenacibaculum maritimum]